jgi:hypothetical protein
MTVIKEQESARLTLTGNYQGLISLDALESVGTLNSICGRLTFVSKGVHYWVGRFAELDDAVKATKEKKKEVVLVSSF